MSEIHKAVAEAIKKTAGKQNSQKNAVEAHLDAIFEQYCDFAKADRLEEALEVFEAVRGLLKDMRNKREIVRLPSSKN